MKTLAKAIVATIGITAIVAVLMALQWIAWNGPEWMLMESPSGQVLGVGTMLSAVVLGVAILMVVIITVTGLDT